MGQRIDGFGGGFVDDEQPFVGQHFKMFAGIFVNVGAGGDGNQAAVGGQRYRTDDQSAAGHGRVDNLLNRFVDNAVVERFKFDFNRACCHINKKASGMRLIITYDETKILFSYFNNNSGANSVAAFADGES